MLSAYTFSVVSTRDLSVKEICQWKNSMFWFSWSLHPSGGDDVQ